MVGQNIFQQFQMETGASGGSHKSSQEWEVEVKLGTLGGRMDDERVIEKVFSEVNRDEVVELALAFGNVKSPAGYEGEVSNHIYEWLNKEGLSPQKQEVLKDRFNVIGQLKGEGGGKSLIFF